MQTHKTPIHLGHCALPRGRPGGDCQPGKAHIHGNNDATNEDKVWCHGKCGHCDICVYVLFLRYLEACTEAQGSQDRWECQDWSPTGLILSRSSICCQTLTELLWGKFSLLPQLLSLDVAEDGPSSLAHRAPATAPDRCCCLWRWAGLSKMGHTDGAPCWTANENLGASWRRGVQPVWRRWIELWHCPRNEAPPVRVSLLLDSGPW